MNSRIGLAKRVGVMGVLAIAAGLGWGGRALGQSVALSGFTDVEVRAQVDVALLLTGGYELTDEFGEPVEPGTLVNLALSPVENRVDQSVASVTLIPGELQASGASASVFSDLMFDAPSKDGASGAIEWNTSGLLSGDTVQSAFFAETSALNARIWGTWTGDLDIPPASGLAPQDSPTSLAGSAWHEADAQTTLNLSISFTTPATGKASVVTPDLSELVLQDEANESFAVTLLDITDEVTPTSGLGFTPSVAPLIGGTWLPGDLPETVTLDPARRYRLSLIYDALVPFGTDPVFDYQMAPSVLYVPERVVEVPEPGTLAAAAVVGAFAVGAWRRRRVGASASAQ